MMMTGWLSLTDTQRITSLEFVAEKTDINAKAIEKDWWVTQTLAALFTSPLAKFMIFKGGTSLSKCFNLIERFSEDIDIGLDPIAFQMEYKEYPTKSEIERLKKKGCAFTSSSLKEALEGGFNLMGIPLGILEIHAEQVKKNVPDKDPQRIFIKYPSLFEVSSYLKEEIQVEVSVRSLKEPFTTKKVTSILDAELPNPSYSIPPFDVTAVEPRKTFLEKVFLLHEEFLKPQMESIRVERMSRHFYDLAKMMHAGIMEEALADRELFGTLVRHRENYSRLPRVDYQALEPAILSFLPPGELLEAYRADYTYMQDHMMYGNKVSFDNVMSDLQLLLTKLQMQ